MKKLWNKVKTWYLKRKLKREYKKRIEELKKRDPFIYD